MSDAETRGRELFDSGLFCAEAVLKTVAEGHGLDGRHIPAMATGFCSGMARSGGPCGAMTGAVMALGLVLGRDNPEQSVEETYAAVRTVMARFEERFGSNNCKELLGVDLDTPEGQQDFAEKKLGSRCKEFTATAAGLVEQALENREE
jgi:C_GCAxxG_C_C family probable redox protein